MSSNQETGIFHCMEGCVNRDEVMYGLERGISGNSFEVTVDMVSLSQFGIGDSRARFIIEWLVSANPEVDNFIVALPWSVTCDHGTATSVLWRSQYEVCDISARVARMIELSRAIELKVQSQLSRAIGQRDIHLGVVGIATDPILHYGSRGAFRRKMQEPMFS